MDKMKVILIGILLLVGILGAGAQPLPSDGVLTIDPKLQQLGERMMRGKQGSIVAIDPTTGEIRCMVSASPRRDSVNRAVGMAYSPGSTFKVAQSMVMLSERFLTPATRYGCNRGFCRAGIHIGCHPHRSPQALVGAIGNSCNAYFCNAFADLIGSSRYRSRHQAINRWHAYMQSFGLGRKLGVDIPGEVEGIMPDSTYLARTHHGAWGPTAIMWVGMGQGEVTATPLQLCNLAAVIANRGCYFTPHIHRGTAEHPLPERYLVRHQSMATPESVETTIQGMRAAVVSGTCSAINRAAYKICGKTGTAENEGADHSLFIGFAPMENPRIAVAVMVENGGFGADMAAPVASLIIEQALTGKLREFSEYQVACWESETVVPYQP